jgi:glycosyltransferase involved in cell wall biosynthesis
MEMDIKVLVISDYRDYHSTRPEASIFIGLAKLGFQISIMTYKSSTLTPEFEAAGIKVIDFHPEKKLNKAEIRTIRDFIVNEKIDIVHLFNSKSIINGIQAAKGLPVKVVLYRGFAGHIHWYDPSAYLKFLHPRVDKIFCNSKGVEQVLQRQLFFDKSKAITINKGHDIEWYKEYHPVDIRKELGLPSNTFLLISVGNNRKMKGIPYMLQAFNQLPDDLPIHLLLVGHNMDTKENLKLINACGHNEKVHLLGFRKDVLNIVSACDVFVLASIYGESITKSVIEAMALGVAPIITDIPGNTELVINNESGLIARAKNSKDLSEAILTLFNDQPFCKQLGKNAKLRIANQLNAGQTILKTKDLYTDLMVHKNKS